MGFLGKPAIGVREADRPVFVRRSIGVHQPLQQREPLWYGCPKVVCRDVLVAKQSQCTESGHKTDDGVTVWVLVVPNLFPRPLNLIEDLQIGTRDAA